ncbi:MAG TPA: 3-isopropylmalate dehydratase small subunit [Anaerolineales bacterium]
MPQFTTLTSRVLPLPIDNIDTDQIIPARFLKTTDKAGLGANLFADWRYNPDGTPNPDFVLNQPRYQGAQVLFAGDNFGCGSSREHAPWALVAAGFQAVVSTSFADIFRNNALKNGLLPVVLTRHDYKELSSFLEADPQAELTVDLPSQTVRTTAGQIFHFPVDSFAKTCLLKGVDQLGYLLGFEKEIAAYESIHG